jgi:RNA polymerase sigma factor (sigma-70 family)
LARVRPFTVVDGGQIDDHAAVHAERSAVLAGLATLPRRQRTALVLRFYEDLSYQEIAETLGCTAGAARSYVSRGLSTLRIDMVCDDGHPRSSVTIERGKQP